MTRRDIAIGTRGSALALAQARLVVEAFDAVGRQSRIVIIETEGDKRTPDTAWSEGAFVAAIERALLDGRVDVAVHSAKDIPTDEDPRLQIGAYLPRADARDALVVRAGVTGQAIDGLPSGSWVGTDSPRRTGFLLARRADLVLHPLHGNVDTRLRRLDDGESDALVLACAGLDRLGLGGRVAERISPEIMPPAPGQGAVAVQIRREDTWLLELMATIDHEPTRGAIESERAFLAASGGGCRAPIGAFAELDDGVITILGGYARADGSVAAIRRLQGPVSEGMALGRELASDLERDVGRPDIAQALNHRHGARQRVIVTRGLDQADELMSALRNALLDPIWVPTIAIELEPPHGRLDRAAGFLHMYSWVVITSANGARAILKVAERIQTELGAPSWAAIGPVTRRTLEHEGIEIHFEPSESSGVAMADELPVVAGDRVLVVRGDRADEHLAAALQARGAEVDDVIAYRTREAPESSRTLLRQAMDAGPIGAVVFTSGSTVRGLVALGQDESIDVLSIPAVCIGPVTADEARSAGFRVLAVSPTPDAIALSSISARALALGLQEIT